jgi:hypothetical protein
MPRDPEAALVTRLYRVIPPGVRSRINRHVSVDRRASLKDRMAASLAQRAALNAGDAVHRVRHRRLHATPGTALVLESTTRRVAQVHQRPLTPLEVRRKNRDEVTAALVEASVPYFAVRGSDDRKAVLGIDARYEPQARAALMDLCRRTAGYYATIHGSRGRKATPLRHPAGRAGRAGRTGVVLRIVWFRTDPGTSIVWGARYACEVEFWHADGEGALTAPRRNRVTSTFAVDEPTIEVSDSLFTRASSLAGELLPTVPTVPSFSHPLPEDVRFPIDAVFTWVDGADESWRRRRAAATDVAYHEESDSESRYVSRDELKYALRSIEMYAPWIRHIYLVTDDQSPAWLNRNAPGLDIVDHRDIFSDPSVLPTFNSHAIESQLHHIDGLSEHFLYLNDDMLLASDVTPQVFFHSSGLSKFFPSPSLVPQGAPQESDVPVTIAAKNNRAAMQPVFGTSLARKLKHAPYALRRDVLNEIESRFPAEHRRTMGARVRSRTDLSLVSNFYQHYAYQTGRAVPGTIRYRYIDLAQPDASSILTEVARRRHQQALCLNTTALESEGSTQRALRALEDVFPLPSRFEK